MNKKAIRWRICHERFSPFLKFHNSDLEKATLHYQANIEISESFYPVLSFLEVALRDNIHQQFSKYYRNKLWLMQSKFSDQLIAAHRNRLQKVIQKHNVQNSSVTEKLKSELSFGFWTSLLDSRYERSFWKIVRLAFPNCPKNIRQRKMVSSKLNQARFLRNRIFHHVPVLWDSKWISEQYANLQHCLSWLDSDLVKWDQKISRFPEIFHKYEYLPRNPSIKKVPE